jgi:hypothetical protein
MKNESVETKRNDYKRVDVITEYKLKGLRDKISEHFIDYCNINSINLHQWYRWNLHLIWEQRKIQRKLF